MVMIGDGTTANVQQSISKLGTNMLILRVGQERRGKPRSDNSARPFKEEDIKAIKNQILNIKAVAAENSSSVNTIYSNKSYTTAVIGTDNDYFIIKDWKLKSGREFDESELNFGQTSCILGTTIVKQLFENEDPIGSKIRLKSFGCTVVGVLESKGAAAFGRDQDEIIIVPLKMFQRKIQGNKDISSILISINGSKNIEKAKKDITLLMQERRGIKVGEDNNFYIRDMEELLSTMTSTTKMFTYLLGSIAAISLLVGGIGIMNIMFATVMERIKEIGIRLALGAKKADIIAQFLSEAILISVWVD